jgi:lipopolysaccharide export system protein LptC
MKGFSLRTLNAQGSLKSEVRGARLQHFPDTDTLEIDQVQIHSYNQQQLTTATANKAISNADGSEVQLMGNAHVVREAHVNANGVLQPRLVFQGEFLHVFVNTEQIKSHKPVLMMRGQDRIEASHLDFNYLERVARFDGRVNATFGSRNSKP